MSFLNQECAASTFKEDFILLSEFSEKYNNFCSNNQIAESQKIKLTTSEEINEFGATLVDNFAIPYVRGVCKGYLLNGSSSKTYFKHGFIKIPQLDHSPSIIERLKLFVR